MRRRRWPAIVACAVAAAATGVAGARASAAGAAPTPAAGVPPPATSALLCLLPSRAGASLDQLAAAGGLSLGIVSAAQGSYTPEQTLLDITQGARIASSAYSRSAPPPLRLQPAGAGAVIGGWAAARARAEHAPQLLRPGLLADSIAGGAGYAGIAGQDTLDGLAAADRRGHVAAASLGSAASVAARASSLVASKRLVVCDLPAGAEGQRQLRALARGRAPGELLLVLERAPAGAAGALLWAGAAGLRGGGERELSSTTTNQPGLIASIDLAPTILRHLGAAALPAAMRGAAVRAEGRLDAAGLRSLMARLRVIGPRRLRALAFVLCAWALLLLLSGILPARRHRARGRAWALRAGAIGLLWAPAISLVGGAIEPSAGVEYALTATGCLALGALTDALLGWPRAPVLPALAALIAFVVDALTRSQLLMRSLLGPDPILGARFYGIGNELKSGLAVVVLCAVAAALYPTRDSPRRQARAAVAMAASGLLLAAVEGSARIGAGVGGVVLVTTGAAVATAMLLPGRTSRRRALIVMISPVAALVALAALDLATAHGTGHYTGSILHARSPGDVRDVLERRYSAAWHELRNHAMPVATALALAACAYVLRRPERLLAPVRQDPVWRAALAGGAAAGVVGALVEDSGPVLLVVAVFALGCELSYLWGRPRPSRSPGMRRAARSHALRRSAAPVR